ncbi:hypothetical protein [Alicyclobacillus acidiphilus]|uniref:hypothetical protein n=1 Tax=Alicyclobacillus acidiphilus TaxID=182455 RepID=UPI0012ED3AEB|nr:hypothetical protein [Alicyclobacillus acidiphilus]
MRQNGEILALQALFPSFLPELYYPKNKVLTGKNRVKARKKGTACETLLSLFTIEDGGMRDWSGENVRGFFDGNIVRNAK